MPETPLRGGAAHWIIDALPRIGRAGSRSASLHRGTESPLAFRVDHRELRRFTWLRWLGTLGAILVLVGGVGAGATPVVGNVFWETPVGSMLGRMLISSTIVTFTGIGMLIAAWLGVGAFVASGARTRVTSVDTGMLVRTFAAWVIPLIFTAPLFTQDIYSYLAQGAVVDRGMDPYAAGPVELLGTEDPLARSVPLIWADSPSPYGPTAMVVAWAIAAVTDDAVLPSVFLHRAVSVASLYVVAWALVRLAQRCGVSPQFALWLGVLNPLTLLHLVGGVHNEALLLAFLLSGMELCLVALHGKPIPGTPDDPVEPRSPALSRNGWLLFAAGVALIAMAGMVKVTGFVALGFVGMALARRFGFTTMAVARAAAVTAATAAATIVAFCLASGLGFGWITSQGGAATVRSWMSLPTLLGISSGFAGRVLGIGDVSEAALSLIRGLGILLAAAWLLRMLWATFRGRIHPLGGYGLAMFAMVLLFPVVHPWYLLWALVPLSGWADRSQFRVAVVAYSAIFSLTVLPRGLGLPPGTVLQIYLGSIAAFVASMAIILAIAWRTKVFRLR
ncbi:alpha 1,6 mannopyranosyltransferase [Corynebacterium xerosis]|uniref:polyprenol phosphomannose-dependent alpha 1,6 mannosyltransferase MptB n=1 Tax=Corynebacterium xerosis TaxID=1725 RepID=UPI0006282380|nr:polyprenol phosphomannose-dependent alpha 1,6 mannosyltransferase MptB [Corynebacterium xerosis]KKO81579.1 alpha 1,6 mannopyranosyltransferase [Corynebacterium xerosis]SQB95146.1 carotene biosynthesis associated membrane protein [Clostridium paraputrificum]